MCKECRKYPAFKEIGAIDCHYKIAGEFVAGIVGVMLFAALVFYAPALMATEFWTDTCGYGVFNNWFEVGYYFQSSESALCDAAQIQSQSISNQERKENGEFNSRASGNRAAMYRKRY